MKFQGSEQSRVAPHFGHISLQWIVATSAPQASHSFFSARFFFNAGLAFGLDFSLGFERVTFFFAGIGQYHR